MENNKTIINNKFFFVLFLVLCYLIVNTGMHSDEYEAVGLFQNTSFYKFLALFPPAQQDTMLTGLQQTMLVNPVAYYAFWWMYLIFGLDHQWIYDLTKIICHLLCVFFVYRFALDYLSKERAVLLSILFVFYPLHETTTYWYMTIPYILVPSLFMFSHHLVRNKRFGLGVLFSTFAAFSYYVSPPYFLGLSVIFLLEKKFKEAFLFALPGVLYIVYYFLMTHAVYSFERKIDPSLSFLDIIRYFFLQIFSFLDAAVGPSYFLKAIWSIGSLSLLSLLLACFLFIFFLNQQSSFSKISKIPKTLFAGLIAVVLLSFAMYAITGLNTHSAFNLGNRGTVYGSLLIAFMLSLIPINKKSIALISLMILLPAFGLSDHWKSWNAKQKVIVENIQSNPELLALESNSIVLVSGNGYSKLGPFSHVEFLNTPYILDALFERQHGAKKFPRVQTTPLSPEIDYKNGHIINPHFNYKYELGDNIFLYDSENNVVTKISQDALHQLLLDREKETRHWVQLLENNQVSKIIIWFSPRLAYLFD